MIDSKQTVATVVLDHSECAAVFQRNRIDFCCRGGMSIEAASAERGLSTQTLLEELERAIASASSTTREDARALSTRDLVDHIVSTHHIFLRETIAFLRPLMAKVARVHGDHNPKLRTLKTLVDALFDALLPHLDDEEQVLFPLLTLGTPESARAREELGKMAAEHLEVGGLLERIRAEADDFMLPDWACNSYRALFAELERVETDTLRHVHLENHVLLPRFGPAPAAEA